VTKGTKEKDEATNKKKDCKAWCLLHRCMDTVNFDKISKVRKTKEAWDILQRVHVEKIKVRLQYLRRQYELLSMEESESVAEYFNRLQ